MSQVATCPAWVVPPPGQVRDVHCIAAVRGEQEAWVQGVFAAVDWVTGGGPAPLTCRADPVTPGVVRGEMMLAELESQGIIGELDDQTWARLAVAPAWPVVMDAVWCQGVAPTLQWLLGVRTQPPIGIPRRRGDGSVMDAVDLYAERTAGRRLPPEDRARIRVAAERDAARYRVLADMAAAAVSP